MFGEGRSDALIGGDGDDVADGGAGNDTLDGATFAPAGGGLAADVWKLTDGAVTEYLKITGVTSLVLGVDYGFF